MKFVIDLSKKDIKQMEQVAGIGIADADDVEYAIERMLDVILLAGVEGEGRYGK